MWYKMLPRRRHSATREGQMRMRREVREHVNRVTGILGRHEPPHFQLEPGERLLASWQRSLDRHRVDPGQVATPRVLTSTDLKDHRGRLESLLRISRYAVSSLHTQVREANYCVLLTDAAGATVIFEGVPALDREFRQEGFRAGTCWSEQDEGTNGVGTTIMDRAPTLVHKTEHFRAHNISFTCSAAPIFGPDEELLAVLDASALYSSDDKKSQSLVFRMVVNHALAIENAYFIETFSHHWILQLGRSRDFVDVQIDYLIAFDPLGGIAAANRKARADLTGRPAPLETNIEKIFDCTALDIIRRSHDRPGAPVPLRCLRTGEQFYALLRAPSPTGISRARAPAQRRPKEGRESGAHALPGFARLGLGDDRVRQYAQQACRVANRRIPILLLGETGTGKESFAKAIHAYSDRRDRPFVAVNCAAIPEGLIESELFGYTDGAFTGARTKGSKGKILQASGGTLFLDEIGDMPVQLQTRLLRVLAESEVLQLGSDQPVPADLHVICATNRDLEGMVERGLFREDLFYRLNVATFEMPRAAHPYRQAGSHPCHGARRGAGAGARCDAGSRRARDADRLRLARESSRASQCPALRLCAVRRARDPPRTLSSGHHARCRRGFRRTCRYPPRCERAATGCRRRRRSAARAADCDPDQEQLAGRRIRPSTGHIARYLLSLDVSTQDRSTEQNGGTVIAQRRRLSRRRGASIRLRPAAGASPESLGRRNGRTMASAGGIRCKDRADDPTNRRDPFGTPYPLRVTFRALSVTPL